MNNPSYKRTVFKPDEMEQTVRISFVMIDFIVHKTERLVLKNYCAVTVIFFPSDT